MMLSPDLITAYAYCQQLTQSHYENFPVASILLPKRLRQAISVIYAFARTADDIADEGDATSEQRQDALAQYDHNLALIAARQYQGGSPIFTALNDVIQQHALPVSLFQDLLSAFRQDITQKRYQTKEDVEDYCRRSANPVGRLLLHLNAQASALHLSQSDAICTALQLVNFYQDIKQDLVESDRIYIPLSDFDRFSLPESAIFDDDSTVLTPLIRAQYQKIHALFIAGVELGSNCRGRLGWEIRTITLTGLTTLKRLSAQNNDDLYSRPRLSKATLLKLACCASLRPIYSIYCQQLLKQIAHYNVVDSTLTI